MLKLELVLIGRAAGVLASGCERSGMGEESTAAQLFFEKNKDTWCRSESPEVSSNTKKGSRFVAISFLKNYLLKGSKNSLIILTKLLSWQ